MSSEKDRQTAFLEGDDHQLDYLQLLTEANAEVSKQKPDSNFSNKAEVAAKIVFDAFPELNPESKYNLVYTLASQPGFKRASGRQGETSRHFPAGTKYRDIRTGQFGYDDKPIIEVGKTIGPATGGDSLESAYWNRSDIVKPQFNSEYLSDLEVLIDFVIASQHNKVAHLDSVTYLKRLKNILQLQLDFSKGFIENFANLVAKISIAILSSRGTLTEEEETYLKQVVEEQLEEDDPRLVNIGLQMSRRDSIEQSDPEDFDQNSELTQLQRHFERVGLVSEEFWQEARKNINKPDERRQLFNAGSNSEFYTHLRTLLKDGVISRPGHPLQKPLNMRMIDDFDDLNERYKTEVADAMLAELKIMRALVQEFIPLAILNSLDKRIRKSMPNPAEHPSNRCTQAQEGMHILSWFVNQEIRDKVVTIADDNEVMEQTISEIISESLPTLSSEDGAELQRMKDAWIDDKANKNLRSKLLKAIIYYGSKAKLNKDGPVKVEVKVVDTESGPQSIEIPIKEQTVYPDNVRELASTGFLLVAKGEVSADDLDSHQARFQDSNFYVNQIDSILVYTDWQENVQVRQRDLGWGIGAQRGFAQEFVGRLNQAIDILREDQDKPNSWYLEKLNQMISYIKDDQNTTKRLPETALDDILELLGRLAYEQLSDSEKNEFNLNSVDDQAGVNSAGESNETQLQLREMVSQFKKRFEIKFLIGAKKYARKFGTAPDDSETESGTTFAVEYKNEKNDNFRTRMVIGLLDLGLNGLEQLLAINSENQDAVKPISDYFQLLDSVLSDLSKYEIVVDEIRQAGVLEKFEDDIVGPKKIRKQIDLFKAVIQFQELEEVKLMYQDPEFDPRVIRAIVYNMVLEAYDSGNFPENILTDGNLETYMHSFYEAVEEEYIFGLE